jgi:hypothetical protein
MSSITGPLPIIIGIDNGVTGGLSAISSLGTIISMLPMPIQKARKGNEIDIAAVWTWIECLDAREKISIVIEEPTGSKSAQAGASMAGSFHALRSMCILKHLRWHRITPQSWQKKMLPGCKTGDTKPRAKAKVKELWPETSFRATDRCTTPHEGLVDATLIAEYARLEKL